MIWLLHNVQFFNSQKNRIALKQAFSDEVKEWIIS